MNGDDIHPATWRCGHCYLVGDTNNFIFLKNTSNIPVGNGSSVKALIIKPTRPIIIITIIYTSVLVLYLLLYNSIRNPPLLCTSCDVSKICLPSTYDLTKFSLNDQIQPKLSVLIKSTNIYISPHKFVLNRSISMEF